MVGITCAEEVHGWELPVEERFTPGTCYMEMNDTGTVLISRYHVRR